MKQLSFEYNQDLLSKYISFHKHMQVEKPPKKLSHQALTKVLFYKWQKANIENKKMSLSFKITKKASHQYCHSLIIYYAE